MANTPKTEQNPYLTNPDRNNTEVQRFKVGKSDAQKVAAQEYPATDHSAKKEGWEGNPSPDSAYAGGHLDWEEGEDSLSKKPDLKADPQGAEKKSKKTKH